MRPGTLPRVWSALCAGRAPWHVAHRLGVAIALSVLLWIVGCVFLTTEPGARDDKARQGRVAALEALEAPDYPEAPAPPSYAFLNPLNRPLGKQAQFRRWEGGRHD